MHHSFWLSLAFAGLSLFSPTLVGADVNPLAANPNASFEQDSLGHTGTPTGWNWEGPKEVARIVADHSPGEIGSKSLLLDYRDRDRATLAYYFWSDMIEIQPDQAYVVSGWIKTDGQHEGFGGSVGYRFYDSEKNQLLPGTGETAWYAVRNAGPTEWTYVHQVVVPDRTPEDGLCLDDEIPAGSRYATVGAFAMFYPQRLWIDGLRMEPYRPTIAPLQQGDGLLAHVAIDVNEIVTVDGNFDERVWRSQRLWQSDFNTTICEPDQVVRAGQQTRFKVAKDETHIYLGIVCYIKDPAQLTSRPRERNDTGIYLDDTVEFYLDAAGTGKVLYHVSVNPDGAIHEEWSQTTSTIASAVAVRRFEDRWQVELAIPQNKLWQIYDEAGASVNPLLWRANVARHNINGGPDKYTSWAYTGLGAFANADTLAPLLLSGEKEVLSERYADLLRQFDRLISEEKLDELEQPDTPDQVKAVVADARKLCDVQAKMLDAVASLKGISSDEFLRLYSETRRTPALIETQAKQLQMLVLELPDHRKEYGYAIYQTPLLERPDNDRLPSSDELIDAIKLRVAGDEIESGTFSIFTQDRLEDIEVSWSALSDGKGNELPKDAVDVRIVIPWGNRNQTDILATDLRIPLDGWLADYLEAPRFISEIAPHHSLKLWVNVTVGASQPAGLYSGEITIRPGNKSATIVPVYLEVLPFDLPQTERMVGFYYHGVLEREGQPDINSPAGMFYAGLVTDESYREEMEFLRRSGFNAIMLPNYADGPMNADYTRRLLTVMKDVGFKYVGLMGSEHIIDKGLPRDEDERKVIESNREALRQRIAEVIRIGKELGIDNLYIYGFDEPHDEDGIMRNKIIVEIVHELGGKVATAVIFREVFESIKDVIDLPLVSWTGLAMSLKPGETPADFVGKTVQSPKTVGYYANFTAKATTNTRLCFGLYLYKAGWMGNIPWALYYLGPGWKAFGEDYPIDTAYYVFPTKDKPISTLRFEAAREGVNDLRYLEYLELLIRQSSDKAKADSARAVLDEILEGIDFASPRGEQSENYQIPPKTYDENQKRLQDLIMELQ